MKQKKNFNLLALLPGYYGGGAEKVMLTYVTANKNKFISFKLFVSNAEGPLKKKNGNEKVELRYKKFIYSIPKLLMEIRKNKISILFSSFPNISVLIIFLKLLGLHNCSIVVRQPNEIKKSLSGNLKLFFLRYLYIKLIHKTDLLIVTSNYMKSEIKTLNSKIKKVQILRNPVHIKKLRMGVRPVATKKDTIRLIYVGRLVYQKGLDIILKILANKPKLELLILGEGKELSNLKKIVSNENFLSRVKFLGYINYPNNLISGSDYFILPSRWEGLPNCALESLGLGTPVITFNRINGLQDYKKSTKRNSIIFCSDEKDLSEKLNNLKKRKDYRNPKLRENLLKDFNDPKKYQIKLNTAILKLND